MDSSEDHQQSKRTRDQVSREADEHTPLPKRRKRKVRHNHPVGFWDSISEVLLTPRALKELDRRNGQSRSAPIVHATTATTGPVLNGSKYRYLQAFANDGGPDLSALHRFADLLGASISMSEDSQSDQRTSRDLQSSEISSTTGGSSTSAYDANFEQRLIDLGIYPHGHEGDFEGGTPVPDNIESIREELSKRRASLSSSQLPELAFSRFRKDNDQARKDPAALPAAMSSLTGLKNMHHEFTGPARLANLEEFDPNLPAPYADCYYGADPSQIESRVYTDLEQHILVHAQRDDPAAPNFFRIQRSAAGDSHVAERLAMHAGAVGARAMFELQNYDNVEPVYDGNAYSIAATYNASSGFLNLYATHVAPPEGEGGHQRYYTTRLDSYATTAWEDMDSFVRGAAAYRNARDWAKVQRDSFIAQANAVARRASMAT